MRSFSFLFDQLINDTAADDGVAVIKDDRLSGGNGSLGGVKTYYDASVGDRLDRGWGGCMSITNFDLGANGRGRSVTRDPIDVTCRQRI